MKTQQLAWEEGHIAAIEVGLTSQAELCSNVHPHITLGMAPHVGAEESNTLLARRFAETDFHRGLAEWLLRIKLKKYTEKLSAWCSRQGVGSLAALARHAAAAAAAVETDPNAREALVRQLRRSLDGLRLKDVRKGDQLEAAPCSRSLGASRQDHGTPFATGLAVAALAAGADVIARKGA